MRGVQFARHRATVMKATGQDDHRRLLATTALLSLTATGREGAARRQGEQIGGLPGHRSKARTTPAEDRFGREQSARVRVCGTFEQCACPVVLDDPPGVHHRYRIAQSRNHTQIVSD
jgi:hypothetical protein